MFRQPWLLIGALAAPAAAALLHAWASSRRRAWTRAWGDPGTLARLMPAERAARRRVKTALLAAALALAFAALAGPQWGVELMPTQTPSRQVFVAFDVSLSMSAEDIKPTRIEKGKRALGVLLDELKGNRVGVIAFAGEPAVFCPLTLDLGAARQILAAVEIGAVPRPGSAISKAVDLAVRGLDRYPGGKAVVLMTDGEDTEGGAKALLESAERAAAAGTRVYAIGIGTPEGEPIPVRDSPEGAMTGYKKDRKGATVITRLAEQALSDAASRTGGAYYRSSPGESEIGEIAAQIRAMEQGPDVSGGSQQYKNRFLIPLALAFLLLLIETVILETGPRPAVERLTEGRRSPIPKGAVVLLLLAVLPSVSRAATAEGNLREGNRMYRKERYASALESYSRAGRKRPEDPRPFFNAGNALFKLQEYGQSSQAFEALARPELPAPVRAGALYNRGNARLAAGDIPGAIASYREALKIRPADLEARHNLAVALRLRDGKGRPQPKDPDKPKPDEKQKPKPDGAQKPEPPPDAPPPPTPTRPQDQLSREDAERILRAAEEKEKAVQKARAAPAPSARPPDVERDW